MGSRHRDIFLSTVDTGADVCVFPASPNDKRKRTPTENLTAANGFEINTWGQRVCSCQILNAIDVKRTPTLHRSCIEFIC